MRSSTAAAAIAVDSVGINLPEPWCGLPDEPDDLVELAGTWDRRWAETGLGERQRVQRLVLLQRVLDVLAAPGATFAAASFELVRRVGVEQVPANDEPLDATCAVTVVPRHRQHAAIGPPAGRALCPPVEVDLPCGRGVRHRRLCTAPGDPALRWSSDVFVVDPHGADDLTIVVELSTTALTLTAELGAPFADTACTLTLLGAADPTQTHACPADAAAWHVAAPTPSLTVHHGVVTGSGIRPLVDGSPLCIGRLGDVAVDDARVSRRHAGVWTEDGVVVCRDLGSRNGTFRRRRDRLHRVGRDEPTLLLDGDELLAGGEALLGAIVRTGVERRA